MQHRQVWIVGAGLAGSLLATLLCQQGRKVTVSERRSSVELEQLAAGRSINLALAERGRYALELAGVADAVLAQAVAMPGRQVHLRDGSQNFQPYAADMKQAIYSVHRARMNRTLLNAAKSAGAELAFDERLVSVDLANGIAEVQTGTERKRFTFDHMIGADGAGSVVRDAIAKQTMTEPYFDTLDHSYKELTIPPGPNQQYQLNPNALHIWPRDAFMLIALPNPDHSFTATLFLQNHGATSFASIQDEQHAAEFFSREFTSAQSLMPNYINELMHHPQGVLGTLRCPRWHWRERALLLGDAAHAIVPFHGQGMNCAFEDCVQLAKLWQNQPDTASCFAQFEQLRQPEAHAIAEMALENYIEMRDLVADDAYRLRKKVEQALAQRHPGWFVPRYELVSFTRYGYELARQRGAVQSKILHALCDHLSESTQVDWELADQLIQRDLAPLPALS